MAANPSTEIRNKHEGSKSKIRNGAGAAPAFAVIGALDLGFVSDFGFRALGFKSKELRMRLFRVACSLLYVGSCFLSWA